MDPKPSPNQKQDPHFIPKSKYTKEDIDCLFQTVNSNTISDEDKINILEQAVAPCPETKITIKDKNPNSLLDSGSMVTLMTQSYFEEHLRNSISDSTPGSAEAHQLFNLKGAGENQIPLTKYFSCDISIGGMTIPEVGILVKTDRQLTSSKGVKTRLPVIVGCNLFRLATFKFICDYGEEALKLFECLLYYYSEENRRNAKDDVEGGVANGKMGVGEASKASSHRVSEEDTIGSHSEYKDKDTRLKDNFPRIKKKFMITKLT